MNNIEILKEFIDDLKPNLLITQAIKNLIQENKELKTKLQEHICIEAHEQVKQLYISKSKLKEKIEELQDEFEYLDEHNKSVNKMAIETLQELLEEGE